MLGDQAGARRGDQAGAGASAVLGDQAGAGASAVLGDEADAKRGDQAGAGASAVLGDQAGAGKAGAHSSNDLVLVAAAQGHRTCCMWWGVALPVRWHNLRTVWGLLMRTWAR